MKWLALISVILVAIANNALGCHSRRDRYKDDGYKYQGFESMRG